MTQCEVILCVWNVRRAWLKNINNLATSTDMASAMFSKLGYIMKYCSNDDVTAAIQGFFNEFFDEGKFLDYLNKNSTRLGFLVISFVTADDSFLFFCLSVS